jgi:hypothetical protein
MVVLGRRGKAARELFNFAQVRGEIEIALPEQLAMGVAPSAGFRGVELSGH